MNLQDALDHVDDMADSLIASFQGEALLDLIANTYQTFIPEDDFSNSTRMIT